MSEPINTTPQQFEFAMEDYKRLGTQEQNLMNKRDQYWTKFFTILLIPSGYAGAVGLYGAVFLFALVPFIIACLSIEIRHDEQVLRYDVRKQMKNLAADWGFQNHDSKYSKQEHQKKRWWHGYYKKGRFAAFVLASLISAIVVPLSIGGLIGIGLLILNAGFIVVTVWCLL